MLPPYSSCKASGHLALRLPTSRASESKAFQHALITDMPGKAQTACRQRQTRTRKNIGSRLSGIYLARFFAWQDGQDFGTLLDETRCMRMQMHYGRRQSRRRMHTSIYMKHVHHVRQAAVRRMSPFPTPCLRGSA